MDNDNSEYSRKLREKKDEYCGKYFRVLTDEELSSGTPARQMPTLRREVVFINDLYQWLPERSDVDLPEYLDAACRADEDGLLDEFKKNGELDFGRTDIITSRKIKETITGAYGLEEVRTPERIEVSDGELYQYVSNMGSRGGRAERLFATMFECRRLREITREEFEKAKAEAISAFNDCISGTAHGSEE